MKTLHLTLKKQYFNEILAGEKTEEYRELKSYWISRLLKGQLALDYYDQIIFRNGYAKNAPTMIVELKGIQIKRCNTPLGNKWQFAIKLGKILETKNIKEVIK